MTRPPLIGQRALRAASRSDRATGCPLTNRRTPKACRPNWTGRQAADRPSVIARKPGSSPRAADQPRRLGSRTLDRSGPARASYHDSVPDLLRSLWDEPRPPHPPARVWRDWVWARGRDRLGDHARQGLPHDGPRLPQPRVLRQNEPADLVPNPRICDLEQLASRSRAGPVVDVEIHGDVGDLPQPVGTAIYRLAQESVTNARRHARHATRIEVRVTADDTWVRLRVSDDGDTRPIRPPASPGYGLIGMIERAGQDPHRQPDGQARHP
jgi:hypothetical protein